MNRKAKQSILYTHTEIAKEWDESNLENIEDITYGSNKKVGWVCSHGHRWNAKVCDRTLKGSGCPYCAGIVPIAGKTDVATVYPQLIDEWDYQRNGSPEKYLPFSNKKVSWICKTCGQQWFAKLEDRTQKQQGCPYCSGRVPISGKNDLATVFPELLSEWNYQKNKISPHNVLPFSNRKVWWTCSHGHEWQAIIANRTSQDKGCPYCSGRKPIVGINDLATTHPVLAQEWCYEKNRNLTPHDVSAGSNLSVWWQCKKGHLFKTRINRRTTFGTKCPFCK